VFAHGTAKPPTKEGGVPFTHVPHPRDRIEALRKGRLASDDGRVTLAMAILGPDDNGVVLAAFNDLRSVGLPIFTAATSDALTIADTSDILFRSRAPERIYAQAAAEYLTRTLSQAGAPSQPVIAPVQAGPATAAAE
jgi:hypothetical protein